MLKITSINRFLYIDEVQALNTTNPHTRTLKFIKEFISSELRTTHISHNRSSFAPRPEHVCQLCTWAGPSKTGFAYPQSPQRSPRDSLDLVGVGGALPRACELFFCPFGDIVDRDRKKTNKWDDAK